MCRCTASRASVGSGTQAVYRCAMGLPLPPERLTGTWIGSVASLCGGSGLDRRAVSKGGWRCGCMTQGKEFKGRQFTAEVILWTVRWYLMFPISYRDLELMLQDRGVAVDHTTLTWAFRSQVHDYGIMGASFGGCSGSKV